MGQKPLDTTWSLANVAQKIQHNFFCEGDCCKKNGDNKRADVSIGDSEFDVCYFLLSLPQIDGTWWTHILFLS